MHICSSILSINAFYILECIQYTGILSIICWMQMVAYCQEKRREPEVLIVTSIFSTKTSCPQDTQLPGLAVSGPRIQEQMASTKLLCKLANHPTADLNGVNIRVIKELSFIISPDYLEKLSRSCPPPEWWLSLCKCSKSVLMWHLGIWCRSDYDGVRLVAGHWRSLPTLIIPWFCEKWDTFFFLAM